MKAKIIIHRTREYANRARKIGIYINGEKIDSISHGETKEYEVEKGENEVYAKIDWCKVNPLILDLDESETIELELGSNIKGWRKLIVFYYVLVNTSEYLYLRPKA